MLTKQITVFDSASVTAYLKESYNTLFNEFDSLNKIRDESNYLYVRLKNEASITMYIFQETGSITVHLRKLYTDIHPYWKGVYPIYSDLKEILNNVKSLLEEL